MGSCLSQNNNNAFSSDNRIVPNYNEGQQLINTRTITSTRPQKRRTESAYSRALDQQLESAKDNRGQQYRLLLLGAGECGKSTLVKQMTALYGHGYDKQTRLQYTVPIRHQLFEALKLIAQQAKEYQVIPSNPQVQSDLQHILIRKGWLDHSHPIPSPIKNDQSSIQFDKELAQRLLRIWNDPDIQQRVLSRKREFSLADSTPYFFERFAHIMDEKYMPSDQDILRVRVRTTGLLETHFQVDNNQFSMIDVGGQRNERRKWIHCFDAVTIVIFLAALSEFDQLCSEDEETNRMQESLDLFQHICGLRWFVDIPIVLFLNKRDLFAEKIVEEKRSISQYFPQYQGPEGSYEAGVNFFRSLFEAQAVYHHPREGGKLYIHITCATDGDNINHVFMAVKQLVLSHVIQSMELE